LVIYTLGLVILRELNNLETNILPIFKTITFIAEEPFDGIGSSKSDLSQSKGNEPKGHPPRSLIKARDKVLPPTKSIFPSVGSVTVDESWVVQKKMIQIRNQSGKRIFVAVMSNPHHRQISSAPGNVEANTSSFAVSGSAAFDKACVAASIEPV
jgi:hypothetical protein